MTGRIYRIETFEKENGINLAPYMLDHRKGMKSANARNRRGHNHGRKGGFMYEEEKELHIRIHQLKVKKMDVLLKGQEVSDKDFFDNLRDLVTLNQLEEAIRK